MYLGKVMLLVALAFALVAGLSDIPHAAAVTAVLGVLAGCAIKVDEATTFLICALALGLAHGALAPVPVVGLYITDVLASVSALFNAAACTVIMRLAFVSLLPSESSAS